MVKSEYIRLTEAERHFGQKNFLNAQLEMLGLIKSFRAYKLIRKEEFLLKVALKSKIQEVNVLMAKLDKLLPKTEEKVEGSKKKRKRQIDLSLQDEIEDIRQKLTRLQVEM